MTKNLFFWAGGVIGLYFFKHDVDQAIIVNGERYRSMNINFFWTELDGVDNRPALRVTQSHIKNFAQAI